MVFDFIKSWGRCGGAVEKDRLKPRVGITGSFGRGNYGDELYVQNYKHWFGSWAELHLLTGLQRSYYLKEFAEARVDLMDSVVLGGGDLLCPYRSKIDRDFIHPSYLRRPLHVAGIGVERNKPEVNIDTVQEWKKFLGGSNVRSISVRDPGSKKWIEEKINPEVPVLSHPDLVCALPLPSIKKLHGPPVLGIVTRHIKHPKEYLVMTEVGRRLASQGWRVRHIIGGVGEHGRKDYENSKHVEIEGKEVVFSHNLDDISRALGECSLVLSMKLHTTLVATMYGVPTVAVNPVVKAKAFMRSIGREELAIHPDDERLLSLVESGVPPVPMQEVQRLREEASDYMRALSQNIWSEFRGASHVRRKLLSKKPSMP